MKKLKFIAMWLALLAVKIPVALSGGVMVPLLWKYKNTHYDDLPSWTKPWANPEDWEGGHMSYKNSLPKWWILEEGFNFKSFFRYHAIRNSANGLRSFEFLDLDIDPKQVEYETAAYRLRYEPTSMRVDGVKTAKYWAWQGNQAGYKYVHIWPDKKKDTRYWFFGWRVIEKGPRHAVFKLGWRVEPRDVYEEIDPNGLRHEDAGFATKVLPYRKG